MKNTGLIKYFGIAAAAVGLAVAAPAVAQDRIALDGNVMVVQTVMENGVEKQTMVSPTSVVPGDRLHFTTDFTNNGDEAVENFVVTNPIPKAVRLADEPGSFVVSIDGGKNYVAFDALGTLSVADGEAATRTANAEDVTHIRWTLALVEPGQSGTLGYMGFVR